IPAEQEWQSAEHGGDCTDTSLTLPFLVEPFGDELLVDAMDPDGTASWSAEDVGRGGPCAIIARFRHREHTASMKLAFSGEQVTAEGLGVTVEHVTKGGDVFKCSLEHPMMWVERNAS